MKSDFRKVYDVLNREYVNAFLTGLGLDPSEVVSFEVMPKRLVVTRFAYTNEGDLVLDHLGPRTVESHFTIGT